MCIGLLTTLLSTSNHRKCASQSNQKFMTQPSLTSLYSEELHYYLFAVKLDRCFGSYNTFNDLSNTVCVLNKTVDLNPSAFNMITGINES